MRQEQDTAAPAPAAAAPLAGRGVAPAVVSLGWLAAMLWSTRATITARQAAEMEVTSAAYALPGAISACLVAGAAVALAALAFAGRRGRTLGPTLRFAVAIGAGLLVGVAAAAVVITINTEGWVYAVLGGTLAAAAILGGALGGVRAAGAVAATCWAALAVFAVGVVLNLFQIPLLRLFGSGDDPASQATAVNWFSITQSTLSGLTAGLVACLALGWLGRRTARGPGTVDAADATDVAATGDASGAAAPAGPRTTGGGVRWPAYAIAGAGPGLLLITAEVLARTAGARVLELAGKISDVELAAQSVLSGARVNNALIVVFIGAVTALVAVGRTLRGPADEPPQGQ